MKGEQPRFDGSGMDGSELRFELQRLHGESYGWALCCCARDRSAAEDVVQEVYVKVLGGKAKYDGRSDFKTWLFAVIRHTAADERRRNLLCRLRLWAYQPPITAEEPAEVTLCRSEVQHAFRQALSKLPGRQQQILQLVFYHDLSLSEAAGVMRVSLGSARTHYDRGKKAIRERLEEHADASRPEPTRPRSGAVPGMVL
jgi:RNA polymerase sigma-70 factor (ECF subfamily)